MMPNFFRCKCLVVTMGIAFATVLLTSVVHADDTIAWWKFDTADPWADSSGNGHSLMGFATSVTDDCDGAGTDSQGSAYFNGIDGWAVTTGNVDLTSYEAVRMSWWMKVDSTVVAIPIEQSYNYGANPGGVVITTNEFGEGSGTAGIYAKGYHLEKTSHNVPPQGWEQYSVEYWPTAPSRADVVKYYKNGVLQADEATSYPNTHTLGGQDAFANDMFYFGARAGSQLFFEGNLDEIKLESFTPSSPLLSNPTEAPTLVPLSNVIAEWTFDDAGNPWADSSGNGNDLTSVGAGVTQSSTTLSGTGSSAYFDNSETARLKTVNTLDLASYRHVQMSWSQLVTSDEVDVLFELGPAGAVGGVLMTTGEVDSANGSGAVMISNGVSNDYNMPAYSHSHGSSNTTWDEMVLDINLDATTNDTVINVYRNGEWASTYYYDNPYDLLPYGSIPESLIDEFFTLGGRDGVGNLNFTGHIDNFTIAVAPIIEDTPGDANRDGKVDGSDVTILAGNWQVGVDGTVEATWAMGDFNGDKKVDGSDVTILAGNWQYGVTANAASVPEPSVILLLWTAFASLLIWKRMK